MVETQVVQMPTYVRFDDLTQTYCGDKMNANDYHVSDHLHPFDGHAYKYDPDNKNWILNEESEWDRVRIERDRLINSFYWKIDRQRDRISMGSATPESLSPLLDYIQTLRDIPQVQLDPLNVTWPSIPQCD